MMSRLLDRWFDAEKIVPLFPFGYGLSYTTFALSDLQVHRAEDGGASLTITVRNTGQRAGDVVPQAYLEAPASHPAGAQFAPDTLVAFDRLTLAPGENKEVTMQVPARAFQYWSVAGNRWQTPASTRNPGVGTSSWDQQLTAHCPEGAHYRSTNARTPAHNFVTLSMSS